MLVNKSKTSSSTNEEIHSVLISFLAGRYLLGELRESLENYMDINFDASNGQRAIQNISVPSDIRITVSPENLRYKLQQFLDNKISAEEISGWAAFVYMTPFYVPEGETDEARWHSGENILWEIIQKLADPNHLASLNVQIVQDYLKLL